jgi:hypothetical protein
VTLGNTRNLAVYKVVKVDRNPMGRPSIERVMIGRRDPVTNMLIPNASYWKYYGASGRLEILPEENSIRLVGASFLAGRIMQSLGISEALDKALGAKRAAMARTAVIHIVARGNVFERVQDYCQGCTLAEEPLTPQSASDLFSSITHPERMGFFKRWLAKQAHDGFLAYDVASCSTCAKGIIDREWGCDIDGEKLPQLNLGCFLSETTGLPAFYVAYPGPILDKSRLPCLMAHNEELGISKAGVVLGRGFCRADNVRHLAREGLDFIIGVDKRHPATRAAIDSSRQAIGLTQNRLEHDLQAISTKGAFCGTRSTMHVYYDHGLADRQRMRILEEIKSRESELVRLKRLSQQDAKRYRAFFKIALEAGGSFAYERDNDKIEAKADDCGFYCLLTNTSLDASQALAKYRRKEAIEKGFDDVKDQIKMNGLGTPNAETTDGKLFCAFIALIVVSEIEKKLGNFMRRKRWSKSHVIAEMEKIPVVLAADGKRLMSPLTETQKAILETFGLTEDGLKAYVLSS